MDRKMECPICKKKALFVGVHDDEGNFHGLVGCEYENDPWSGLSYALHHDGWGDCPLCTGGANGVMGGMLFDKAEEAVFALTPPNEWVEALEAINNAAVAYIEGGPYENDLPGMELAVEIDRLSRDFVRPPNEPLTLEQLREMDGEPVWVEDVKHWALIDIEKGGQWDGVPFAIWAENGMKFTYNIKNRGLHCYRRPPEGEA